MENPLRVAEDAAVLDLLADGRLEVGFGSGGTPTSFLPFGLTFEQRGAAFADHLHVIQSAWRGDSLTHPDNHLYPPAPQLADRIWIATFSVDGAVRAARAGHGLMLSRTQPRPADQLDLTLDAIQNPIVDAYLEALPAGIAPRILASRTAFVADSDDYALKVATPGLTRQAQQHRAAGHAVKGDTVTDLSSTFARDGAAFAAGRFRSPARHGYLIPGPFGRAHASRHAALHRTDRRTYCPHIL
jgi:alkanesulfonate monooxygenase SsuD/methylene tetrahydromethanopterin reductase-like flavin-dependent oxidoreductase (luciferase family)